MITTLKAGSSPPFQHLLNKYRRLCKVLPNFQRTAKKGDDESNPRFKICGITYPQISLNFQRNNCAVKKNYSKSITKTRRYESTKKDKKDERRTLNVPACTCLHADIERPTSNEKRISIGEHSTGISVC